MHQRQQRIIVTGGAGFIGSHVVDVLADAGNHVVVIDNLSSGSRRNLARHLDVAMANGHRNGHGGGRTGAVDSRVALIDADITDANAMHDLIVDADVVIHLAVACSRTSLGRPRLVHDVNATGSLNVCLAARRNRVGRLVYVSSSEVYGTARSVPMDEDHATMPTTVYGASKLAGEAYASAMQRLHGLPVVTVRPFNSYGPREPSRGVNAEVIPKFVLRTMAGDRPVIFGSGLQTRDFTWVEDTARGIVAAAQGATVGTTVNVGRGQEVSIRQLADKVLSIFGRGGEIPIFDASRPGDVQRHCADVKRADRMMGWRPTVYIDEGLRRYIDWVSTDVDAAEWLAYDSCRNW